MVQFGYFWSCVACALPLLRGLCDVGVFAAEPGAATGRRISPLRCAFLRWACLPVLPGSGWRVQRGARPRLATSPFHARPVTQNKSQTNQNCICVQVRHLLRSCGSGPDRCHRHGCRAAAHRLAKRVGSNLRCKQDKPVTAAAAFLLSFSGYMY
jgi:hypothetical protein